MLDMKPFALVALVIAAALPMFGQSLPLEGTRAPIFRLRNQDGAAVSLWELRGRWVVLFFYPRDFSSGCTEEVKSFQRDFEKYAAMNVALVGISLDSVESHRNFCAKEGLKFDLLADSGHKVTEEYGSLREYNGKAYAARNSFLIDPAGMIRKVYASVNPAEHSEQVLADIDSIEAAR